MDDNQNEDELVNDQNDDHEDDEDQDDDDDLSENSQQLGRRQAFEDLLTTKNLTLKFTKPELTELTCVELKVIKDYWGTDIRDNARKNQLVDAIFADPQNVDPQWLINFRAASVLLPPYHKNELKHIFSRDLRNMASEWNVAGFAGMDRRTLINALLGHTNNQQERRGDGYTHSVLNYAAPNWPTDDEPPSDDDDDDKQSEHTDQGRAQPQQNAPINVQALIRGISTYKDIYKCTVKITGAADENLCMKIFDLEQYQRTTQCKWTDVYQHLVVKGLDGIARERYRCHCMVAPESVSAYEPLIRFLFTQFPGDSFVDKLYSKLARLKQDNEQIFKYWLEFQTVLNEYRCTIRIVLKYHENANRSLMNQLTELEAYRKFVNSLNDETYHKLSNFIEIKQLQQTVTAIAPAIHSTQRVMHPGHGIRDRSKPNRNRERGRSRGQPQSESGRKHKSGSNKGNGKRDKSDGDRTRSRSRSRHRGGNQRQNQGRRDRSPKRDNKNKNVTCYNCGKKGHYSNKCRAPKKTNDSPRPASATVPQPKKDKKSGKTQLNWISAPHSRISYRSDLFKQELKNVDTSFKVNIPNDYAQSYYTQRHTAKTDNNSNNSNNNDNNSDNNQNCTKRIVQFNTPYRRRYIYTLSTINTTNTKELDLSAPVLVQLRIKDYHSNIENGMYSGFIDTGSNTPAMKTDFVKSQNFPIYSVKRPFEADTANGEVIVKYATVLEIENENDDGNKYWMKAIFYLFNELKIDILIDRRLMRLLGYDCNKCCCGRFRHKPQISNVLTNEDDIFWDKLLNPDELPTVGELNYDSYPEGDIDYDHGNTHDPDAVIPCEYTEEGNALQLALARSTFDTTNASTAGGAADWNKHTYDPFVDQTAGNTIEDSSINFVDVPLAPVNPEQIIKHKIIDDDDRVIDEFTNHTYDDTFNPDDDPNKIDGELALVHEDEKDLVPLREPGLQPKPLRELYKHTNFINTNVKMQLEMIDKYLNRLREKLQLPHPEELRKQSAHDPMRRVLYPIQMDEDIITSVRCGELAASEVIKEFQKVVDEYKDTIAKSWADCGKIEGVYLKLDLKPGAKPFKYAPYKSAYEQMDEIERQCKKLLEAGFIRPSNSNYASPIVMVPKKQVGKIMEWRMCIDYRKLNSMTLKDHYPLPNIQSLYRKFAGNTVFSSLDLRHAYHHIQIRPEDRHKTAFITHKGLFEWIRMTFGFANAPAAFQRAVNYIFRDFDFVIVYLDDILVLSKSDQEHLMHLRLVFQKLSEYDLRIRLDKCYFFQTELKYLGFILDAKGVRPDPEYVKKVIQLQAPTDKPSLLRVIGMIQWLHRYIPRLSDYMWPLTRQTKKHVKFLWNDECDAALDRIKGLVNKAKLLRHPDLSKTFYVICDASNFGIGAVLMQKHGDILEPCEFWSRLFSDSEKHWHVSEKELSAIVFSIEKWAKYLLGKHFYVFTDHKNLETLHKKYESGTLKNSKLLRWLLRIEQFDFTCLYIEGIINLVADYLSRDICMVNIQKEHDSRNNDQSMDYSVILKRNTNYFINVKSVPTNSVGICFVKDFDGGIKQIHTLSNHHIFAVLRRSPRLLAKKQKEEALAEYRRIPRAGINEQRNSSHQAITANSNKSTAGQAGRSLQSHSARVGNSNSARRATSDGFGSFPMNVRESPLSEHKQSTARGRDVFGGVNDDVTIDGSNQEVKIDERPSKSEQQPQNDSIQREFVVRKFENISEDLSEIERIFDLDFSEVVNVNTLRQQTIEDPIYGSIYLLLSGKADESLIYTLPKVYQHEIIDKKFIIKNKLLYYIPQRAYVIPSRLRHPLLTYFHKSNTTLHQGIGRMLRLIRNRVYWRGISKDVEEFVGECKECILGKATPNKKEGYMQLFEAHEPFEIVHMDIVGPLPITRSGNRYILTMMDRYSRMVKLVPLPVITAKCICVAFRNNWLLQYGVPENILTDRGTYFTGLLFQILSKMFGFKMLFTTSYHPKTNGRLERFHRYLKQRLRIIAKEQGLDFLASDDWDIFLPNISFSYNVTPNYMSNHSPYNIIYPKLIKLPIDRIFNLNINEAVDETITTLKNPKDARLRALKLDAEHRAGIRALIKHRDSLRKEIAAATEKYNAKRKELYDKNRVAPTQYRNNQTVWVDVSVGKVGNARKLGINRKRAIIMDKISQNAYIIKYDDGKVEPMNVDRLYTLSKSKRVTKHQKESVNKMGKNKRRNYKRRAKKRKIKNALKHAENANKKRKIGE